MSEIAGAGHPGTATAVVHESYAFACMRCGHGWEQSYEIEHHLDPAGRAYVTYLADGQRVPSPLSTPTCLNCGGHVVRIMRAGQVSSVLDLLRGSQHPGRGRHRTDRPGPVIGAAGPIGQMESDDDEDAADPDAPDPDRPHRHWSFSHLLHPFRHRDEHDRHAV
ncbi:hypothetical protein ACSMX9_17980 [Streptomyces sp. LE64]|uniref:hypothetical protein n=1 Tax=Streptomyces sp. LE64 TaxID=3448653 RepID=UPI004042D064